MLTVQLDSHIEGDVNSAWSVQWENEALMAVYKPPCLPVNRTSRNLYNTLISLIRRQTPYYDAHLLHRLDEETDGLVLIAKNKAADLKWKPQLNNLITRKVYHAWVHGAPQWDQYSCQGALSPRGDSEIRSQIYVVTQEDDAQYLKPRWCHTDFRVLHREGNKALIECELFTGRKHQIRAQLAHLGHPIVGDKVYAHQGRFYLKRLNQPLSSGDLATLESPHQKLTAQMLEIQPDSEGDPVCIALTDTPGNISFT